MIRKREDVQGQTFNYLTALVFVEVVKRQSRWLFRCKCTKEVVLRLGSVKNGNTKSCGCWNIERVTKHGHAGSTTKPEIARTFRIWKGMKARCLNPNNKDFERYGAVGITVCPEWTLFANFLRDMGECPTDLSIDRIDNAKGYSPENARWATTSTQNINRGGRKNSSSRFKGVSWSKSNQKWKSDIKFKGRSYFLGYFTSEIVAARAYNEGAKKYHGEFAWLNVLPDASPTD